ncbi:MAG: molybdopterin molybdotransferase MoeA [Arcobacteraceae bacterium]
MAVTPNIAMDIILNHTHQTKFKIVPLENALGKISAQDLFAQYYLPKFDNSAMDGYAVRFEDAGKTLNIIDTIFAGDDKDIILNQNECVKIMTGAKIPENCTAIIPFEDATIIDETQVLLPQTIRQNQHIRYIGEDIKLGSLILEKGQNINFAAITLLASQGVTHLKVYRHPKIVVFASGEELKLHYEKIESYQIYNSNTPTLIARCQEFNCDVTFIGQAKDSVDSLKQNIANALGADLIITTGGVSVGEADFTKEAFDSLGFETFFEGILIKPGKPTIFGKIQNTLILNLPGNPLACGLIFELFGTVILQKLKGSKDIYPNFIVGKIDETLKTKAGRTTIVPGFFDGEYFKPSAKRSPGMVNVLNHCNSMIVLAEEVNELKKDKKIKILPINWAFFSNISKDYLTHE